MISPRRSRVTDEASRETLIRRNRHGQGLMRKETTFHHRPGFLQLVLPARPLVKTTEKNPVETYFGLKIDNYWFIVSLSSSDVPV